MGTVASITPVMPAKMQAMAEQHRGAEAEIAFPQGSQPGEHFHAGGTAISIVVAMNRLRIHIGVPE